MAEPVSLSKLLLQSRGQEVIRQSQVASVFKISEKDPLPVKIVPRDKAGEPSADEQEFFFKGTETLTTAAWNIEPCSSGMGAI